MRRQSYESVRRHGLRLTSDICEMEYLVYILLVLIPSVVVFLTAYLLIKKYFENERKMKALELKKQERSTVIPMRLQAYERCILFLERITTGSLVLRVHKSHLTSKMLHTELVRTIREEFDHNITQQIYLSDKAWEQVKWAKEETIKIVNLASEKVPEGSSGVELSKKIFEFVSELSVQPAQEAILFLRQEARNSFMK